MAFSVFWDALLDIAVLSSMGGIAALLLVIARQRLEPADDSLVPLVNELLPQTQCAQCGYPGCRPYAEAVVAGEAINRCPPGGETTIAALAELLGREVQPLDETCGKHTEPQVAVIREDECIGCTLCIAACPVDAIIGAREQMHTVIEPLCTGCDLCREPCPVDCIDLVHLPLPDHMEEQLASVHRISFTEIEESEQSACINCGYCAPVCPRGLQPQLLYWYQNDTDAAINHGLDRCIECGLCDRSCPSELPLTRTFIRSKAERQQQLERRRLAEATEQRYLARESRLAAAAERVARRPGSKDRQSLLEAIKVEGDRT